MFPAVPVSLYIGIALLLNFRLYLFDNNNTRLQIGQKVIFLGGE